ncbi:MAG: DUF1566 domain-containing protein [Sulfurovum sp.]|nr:DUF1566 domain-containing protein [Sulfurovum sp.]MCB4760249.1 DUF1566 domain-containing protein [Sulfurovum sp.]
MKKYIVFLWSFFAITFGFSGGDMGREDIIVPNLGAMIQIEKPYYAKKIYIDEETNLMWQDASYTDAEDGAYANNYSVGKVGVFQHAVRYCHNLDYAGYQDWRLPTANELMAVHHQIGQNFVYFRSKDFWTSTPTTAGKHYVVYPADAYRYKRSKKQSNYIRCVRHT